MTARRGKSELGREAHDHLLAALIVDAERAARDEDLGTFGPEFLQRRAQQRLVEHVGRDETVRRPQVPARRQLDLADVALAAREQRFDAARHAEDADLRDVAFQQRVRRLRRAVRDEHDVGRQDTAAF